MPGMKIEFLAIIWGALVVLGGMAMIFVSENAVSLIIVLSIVAFLSTMAIALTNTSHNGEGEIEKLKNSGTKLDSSLLNLLDEDDLDELRTRVKRRLIDQIEGSGDGELSSLDALLADQQRKRR